MAKRNTRIKLERSRDHRWYDPAFLPEMMSPYLGGDDSDEAVEGAVRWIYMNYAAWGYASYLKYGPGFIVGPIVIDGYERLLSPELFKATAKVREPILLSV